MNYYTPLELTRNYGDNGRAKANYPTGQLLWMALIGGLLIAFGAAVATTATHAVTNAGLAKMISGLLFPFGLGMVIMLGVELFTGNIMIIISVLEKKTTVAKMLRNWGLVYLGNMIGAIVLAAGLAVYGQLDLSGGQLAVSTVAIAAAKASIPFMKGIVFGIFANVLVCIGVLISISGKDTVSRIAGAYIPVAFFVILGFEHSVANMFYIPAGLFAMEVPEYASLVAQAGIDVSSLNWAGFFLRNLIPVTIGNILGGLFVGVSMWYFQLRRTPPTTE
ncbi:MAG TPA: formate/nitrite transporter family protein [Tissierellia bacterium]|nr:formate/nitrite transporter family protein [Tissierellia bacterium]